MKNLFKAPDGTVYAYAADGSEDAFMRPGLTLMTAEEVEAHLNPPPAAITPTEVDAERDRRISSGFEFNGVRYQSRLSGGALSSDWEIFSGKAMEALIAIMNGAQPLDYRWSDPDEDFTWIAEDNSRVLMDAQTVIALCQTAGAHRSKLTFAGSNLKALDPIPMDFRDDKWWGATITDSPDEEVGNE